MVGGTVADGLVAGGPVTGDWAGAGVGDAAGDVPTLARAVGAEEVGDASVVPPAGRPVVGPASVDGVEAASGERGAVMVVVVVVDAFARGDVVTGIVAPEDAQAARTSPPATTGAIDPTACLMRSVLSVRGADRHLDGSMLTIDYRSGARNVHAVPGPTWASCARSGASGAGGGADDRRRCPMTASRLGRPAPSPTTTSAMAASATLNS